MTILVKTPKDLPEGSAFVIATLRDFPSDREGGNNQKAWVLEAWIDEAAYRGAVSKACENGIPNNKMFLGVQKHSPEIKINFRID